MDNKLDRKIDDTATLFLLVQNRHQTDGWTLIGSGANGLGILEWHKKHLQKHICSVWGLRNESDLKQILNV